MNNYIRRLKIKSLFAHGNDLNIDFEEQVNCIYGANGTGKTTVINILVASLYCDIKQLSRLPFQSIAILTSSAGKKRPKPFLEVSKNPEGLIAFKFMGSGDLFECTISSRKNIDPTEEVSKKHLVDLIRNHLAITYVPLTRMQESEIYDTDRPDEYLISQVLKSRNLSASEIADILDPNRRMLNSIESLFKQKYAETQKEINTGLDHLKDSIIGKMLLDRQSMQKLSVEINKGNAVPANSPNLKSEEYSEKLKSVSLSVDENALTEHFEIINETVKSISDARDNFFKARNAGDEDSAEHFRKEYWESERKYRAIYPINERLLSILNDIEYIDDVRSTLLKPFNHFQSVVNEFLTNKKFKFSSTGGFEIYCGERKIELVDLSSGEKHMIALLGRVSLSPESGAVFIADEPELSLHLEWQRKMLPSILELSPNIQIIVATHSPAIIPPIANEIDLEECLVK